MKNLEQFEALTSGGGNSPSVPALRRSYNDIAAILFQQPETPVRRISLDNLCQSWLSAVNAVTAHETKGYGAAA